MSEDLIVSKGRLYEEFKRTVFYEDLKRYLDEQIQDCKDQTVTKTVEGKYEEAKECAHKLSGYQSVIQYIEDSISAANDAIEHKSADEEYEKQIPRHV